MQFNGEMAAENRWEKASEIIPWDLIDEEYSKSFSREGHPAYSSRLAFGAIYIKERLNLSDAETVEQIRENPFLQMFLGFMDYSYERPFDPSLMVHFRKRLGKEFLARVNDEIIKTQSQKNTPTEKDDDDSHDDQDSGTGSTPEDESQDSDAMNTEETKNSGKLILDATCAPQDIKHPKDVDLLNDCRESTESIIDKLHGTVTGKVTKPRTDRNQARKRYLRFIKSKKPRKQHIRRAVREQMRYVNRNLNSIEWLVQQGADCSILSAREWKDIRVSHEVLRQQKQMYERKEHRVPDRIVSLSQPHVRAIIRGKARTNVEFGAKVNVSIVNGYAAIENLSWNPYNEGGELIACVERYQERYGQYPSVVLADKIYRTRENLRYCKENGIRLSGPPLGRPVLDKTKSRESLMIELSDNAERNEVEGKFGLGKRKFGLDLIMSKLPSTSESEISMQFIVMNVEKRIRDFLSQLFIFKKFNFQCSISLFG